MPQLDAQPWSPVEVMSAMQGTIQELENAVATLKALGVAAAQKSRDYKVGRSHWMLHAKVNLGDLKSDTMREAWVYENTDVPVLEMERDIAEHAYKDQQSVVRSLQSQADLLRSMKRGFEDMADSWGGRPGGQRNGSTRRVPNESPDGYDDEEPF